MAIFVSDSKPQYDPPPEGLHQAVCVDVLEPFTRIHPQHGAKTMTAIVWQLEELNPKTGKRYVTRRQFGFNLSQKGHLRPFLESWRGRKFTQEELERFDLERLLGVNAQIQIIHNEQGGVVYGNISAIMPLQKNQTPIAAEEYVRVKDRPTNGDQPHGEHAEGPDADDDTPF